MPSYKQEEPKSSGAFFVEPGIYQLEIVNAVEKLSQNGNEMIKLITKVVLPSGGVGPEIHDHLVFTAKASWKIDQFLASIGQAVIPGEEVSIDADDLVGRHGPCHARRRAGAEKSGSSLSTQSSVGYSATSAASGLPKTARQARR
jgi:hypothetical protein